jgi:hypothetical protein
MNPQERWNLLSGFDDELLKGGVILSEWRVFIVKESDMAFAAGCYLPTILTAASGVETYLRAEHEGNDKARQTPLINQSDLPSDLKADLHRLRRYRNRWVHVKAPLDDASVLTDPPRIEREFEAMAHFAVLALRRTIYSIHRSNPSLEAGSHP